MPKRHPRIDIILRTNWFVDQLRIDAFPNTSKLKDRFKIEIAQAQRDISFMRETLLIPMEYDPSEKGYRMKKRNVKLPLLWVNDEDLLLMAMAQEILQDEESQAEWDELFKKLNLVTYTDIQQIKDHIHYKGAGTYHSKPGILSKALDAILNSRACEIEYHQVYQDIKPFKIKVWPLYLVFYRGNWYMIACYRESLRNYALARVEQIDLLDETANLSHLHKEVKRTVRQSFGIFTNDEDEEPQEIVLHFSAKISSFIETISLHHEQKQAKNDDGSLTLSFPSFLSPELIAEILKYGPDVTVLEPAELKEMVMASLKSTLENYSFVVDEQKEVEDE